MELGKMCSNWYQSIPNWHFGKLILIWVVDIFVLILMLLEERKSSIIIGEPGNYSESIGGWLFLSIPVILITWKWIGSKEKKEL